MKIELDLHYIIETEECNIDYLVEIFKKLSKMILVEFVKTVLIVFADKYMKMVRKPFSCTCGNNRNFIWKTKNAKPTTADTVYGSLELPQMQVQCKKCDKKMFITRSLLGIDKHKRMSNTTEKILALIGVLSPFRVTETILNLVGVKFNRMRVWRCVQKVGEGITFSIDPDQEPSGQADGTGIPIRGIRKRGMELKVFIQNKVAGGARVASLDIGRYEGGWDRLFAPLRQSIGNFKQFLLTTDGDTSIFKDMKCLNVITQRCLWHIPHQLKYSLWSDGVKRRSENWLFVMRKIFDISAIRPHLEEEEINAVLTEKKERLDNLIKFCDEQKYKACASYLQRAEPDMFTALENRLNGKTSSLAERVMKTVNMRINVGKWKPSGALNAMKVRLAYYYNDWQPGIPEAEDAKISLFGKVE